MESRFSKRVTNPPMEHLKTQRYYSLSQTVLWLKALSFRNRPSEGRALSKYRSFLHLGKWDAAGELFAHLRQNKKATYSVSNTWGFLYVD